MDGDPANFIVGVFLHREYQGAIAQAAGAREVINLFFNIEGQQVTDESYDALARSYIHSMVSSSWDWATPRTSI
jgi:hypothetical protein